MELGYTLVELIIVMTVISIVSMAVYLNTRSVTQDQILVTAVSDIQSFLRLAQANATSSTVCDNGLPSSSWSVEFDNANQNTLRLMCDKSSSPQKTLILNQAIIPSIMGSSCLNSSFPSNQVSISFSSVYGKLTFVGADQCLLGSSTLNLTIRNLTNGGEREFKVSKGGAIDVTQ